VNDRKKWADDGSGGDLGSDCGQHSRQANRPGRLRTSRSTVVSVEVFISVGGTVATSVSADVCGPHGRVSDTTDLERIVAVLDWIRRRVGNGSVRDATVRRIPPFEYVQRRAGY
jgi:hypothetical protein